MGHPDLYNENQIRDKLLLVLIFLRINNVARGKDAVLEVPMGADALYYIMDYSGNYYRTNQADQLVAVAGEQDATVFTFAQANSRICVGKKAAFYCMVPIEEKAEDRDVEAVECGEAKEDAFVSSIKELAYDEVSEPVEKNVSSYDLSEIDWAEYLTHFTYLVEGLKDYREQLAKKHSDIEQKICDILHYIELCETNEEEAIDLVELLRVCRENRRDIKDELQRIEYFQNNFGTNMNVAKAKQALKCIKGLETRKYRPRKYDELFENCILKDKRLQRADIRETQPGYEIQKHRFGVEPAQKNEGGEETMLEERNFTPFDGKENDWLSFARQQAEFYRNAGQYITNIQMDIREIDEEIEEILLETEDANCNVTQGYKVFKQLKELRLERKVKLTELDCLYALTDYIDCDALADTCEANLAEVEGIMGISEQNEVANLQLADNEQEEKLHVVENIKDMVG